MVTNLLNKLSYKLPYISNLSIYWVCLNCKFIWQNSYFFKYILNKNPENNCWLRQSWV